MKLVSFENLLKYNELLNQKTVRSVNSIKPDSNGNVRLGTEKSTFNKVVYDTGYFSIGTTKTYNFDLTGSDLENVSKENVNIRLVAKVTTAHNGFEVGDIAELSPGLNYDDRADDLDVCSYIRGNILYIYSGKNSSLSVSTGTAHLERRYVQIKAILTAFIPDDGSILLIAEDQNNSSKLIGLPDGTLTWGGKTIAPVTGEIKWFAFNTVPDGYIICNGAKVSRTTYADLFAAIGTAFGSGDGSTTFDLPDLIDRFAQGSRTVGTYKGPGLPNITGATYPSMGQQGSQNTWLACNNEGSGALYSKYYPNNLAKVQKIGAGDGYSGIEMDASRSNSIYGNSTTVQPPTLTLLPCIKY